MRLPIRPKIMKKDDNFFKIPTHQPIATYDDVLCNSLNEYLEFIKNLSSKYQDKGIFAFRGQTKEHLEDGVPSLVPAGLRTSTPEKWHPGWIFRWLLVKYKMKYLITREP